LNDGFSYYDIGSLSLRKGIRITSNAMYGYVQVGWGISGGPCEAAFTSEEEEDKLAIPNPEDSTLIGDYIVAKNFAMGGLQALDLVPWDTKCT
jgi:hypothetical protein